MVKLLESNGWVFESQKGSHRRFKKQGSPWNLSVPMGQDPLGKGLIKNLLKEAELEG
jgi:predicted RNA binding protein YcfA (HicA-like mRNA interferase family)